MCFVEEKVTKEDLKAGANFHMSSANTLILTGSIFFLAGMTLLTGLLTVTEDQLNNPISDFIPNPLWLTGLYTACLGSLLLGIVIMFFGLRRYFDSRYTMREAKNLGSDHVLLKVKRVKDYEPYEEKFWDVVKVSLRIIPGGWIVITFIALLTCGGYYFNDNVVFSMGLVLLTSAAFVMCAKILVWHRKKADWKNGQRMKKTSKQ